MSRSNQWEKTLRRKLRKRRRTRTQTRVPGREILFGFLWCTIGVGFMVAMVHQSGGVGLGLPCGLAGGFFGLCVQGMLMQNLWLGFWGPVDRVGMRRIQMRSLPGMALWLIVPLGVGVWLAGCLFGGLPVWHAAGAAAAAFLTGFAMSWLRLMKQVAWVGLIALVGFYFFNRIFLGAGNESFDLAVAALPHLWVPSMPWSWWTMPVPYAAVQVLLVGAMLVGAARAARSIWHDWSPPLVVEEIPEDMHEASAAADDDDAAAADDDDAPADPMSDVRKSVHHGWFGMAGYLPQSQPLWFDHLLWRWLAPRERWLSCLGTYEAHTWFPGTFRGIFCLLAQALVFLLMPHAWVAGMLDRMPLLCFLVCAGFAIAAVGFLWPGRKSAFDAMLGNFQPEGLGVVPAIAILPVTAREWLRAFAKEWLLRSAWFGVLCGLAVAVTLPVRLETLAGAYWLGLAPFVLVVACFPLSASRRLVTASAGMLFEDHGATRAFPAVMLGLACGVAALVAVGGAALRQWDAAAISLVVMVVCGAGSLWFALARVEAIRLDQRPRQRG